MSDIVRFFGEECPILSDIFTKNARYIRYRTTSNFVGPLLLLFVSIHSRYSKIICFDFILFLVFSKKRFLPPLDVGTFHDPNLLDKTFFFK